LPAAATGSGLRPRLGREGRWYSLTRLWRWARWPTGPPATRHTRGVDAHNAMGHAPEEDRMAILMISDASDKTLAQYDEVGKRLAAAGQMHPPGRLSHAGVRQGTGYLLVAFW